MLFKNWFARAKGDPFIFPYTFTVTATLSGSSGSQTHSATGMLVIAAP